MQKEALEKGASDKALPNPEEWDTSGVESGDPFLRIPKYDSPDIDEWDVTEITEKDND